MSTRQYARLVSEWIGSVGLDPRLFGTHSLRRTKATLIYRRTGNLRAVQLLVGHYLPGQSGHALHVLQPPLCARKRVVHCNKLHRYSITSARPSSDSGRRGRSTAPLAIMPRAAMEPARRSYG